MSDSEKPFACTMMGCNMSFVNEDHLTVHKKKHDMMLNLGINNKNNSFIADQTPTPTRFIRNCEEVGLFQDLPNDNPFEETFRRAVEGGKNDVLVVPEVIDDNTLHTPNIFPHIEECTNSININTSTNNRVSNVDTNVTESNSLSPDSNTVAGSNDEIKQGKNYAIEKRHSNVELFTIPKTNEIIPSTLNTAPNDNKLIEPVALINSKEMQLLLKTQDGKVLKLITAPVVDVPRDSLKTEIIEKMTTKSIIALKNLDKLGAIQDQKLSVAKMKLKQVLTKNGAMTESHIIERNKNDYNKQLEPTKGKEKCAIDYSKKQAILERNRASSMRARAKRKVWVEQLQESLKVANDTNATLQAQVKNLNAQVTRLKTLLLAHKDCPVTKAMEEGNGIVVNPKVLTIKPSDVMASIPIVTETMTPMKRPYNEKPIMPKKKPLILSNIKSSIILPKARSTANTITLHGVDTVKTIPAISIVTPIVTQPQSSKTIVSWLNPDSSKISLVQNLSINENVDQNTVIKNSKKL